MIGGIFWIIGGGVIFVAALRGKVHRARPGGAVGPLMTKRWERFIMAVIGAAFVIIGLFFVISSR